MPPNALRLLVYCLMVGWLATACVTTKSPPATPPATSDTAAVPEAAETPRPKSHAEYSGGNTEKVASVSSQENQAIQTGTSPAKPAINPPQPTLAAPSQADQTASSTPDRPGETPVGPGRYTTTRILQDGIHDPNSSAVGLLQDPATALAAFPMGKRKELDWVKTLNNGLIQPRANVKGTVDMELLDLDIIMTKTKNMPFVKFPHRPHTQWLACANCHPGIFEPKAGANPMDMNAIFRGQYCGQCHGRVSFSVMVCERCHTIPHKDSPKVWW